MLDTLRKGVKSWVAKGMLMLLIASFAVWGIGADMFGFSMNSAVVEAGDTEISAERFADEMNRQRQLVSRQAGELVSFETIRAAGLDSRVLAAFARDAAFRETLDDLGMAAPDSAVADLIRENEAFRGADGSFSRDAYQRLLAQQGYTPQEFEELTRTLLAQQILTDVAARGAAEIPGLAPRIAAFRGEERSASWILLPPSLASDPGTPDDAMLETYYTENAERFVEPERRSGRYLVVDPLAIAAAVEPTEEELRAEYEVSIDAFTREATRTVDQLSFDDPAAADAAYARLDAGEITFEGLAEELGIPEADYALGAVTEFDLAEAVADVAFAAKEPGLLEPISTIFGVSIVRITALDEGGAPPFEDVRDRIDMLVRANRARAEAPELANRIDDLRADGSTLAEIAEATGLTLGTFTGLSRDGFGPDGGRATDITASPVFLEEVFTALDLEERDIVETDTEGYLLVMVDQIIDSHQPELSEIRDRVIADWQDRQRLGTLDTLATELSGRIAEGETLGTIAAETGTEITETGAFQRGTAPEALPPALISALFAAETGAPASARASDNSGVVLAVLTDIAPLDAETMQARTGQIEQLLERSIAGDTVEYFARAVQNSRNPVIHTDAVEEVFRLLGAQTQGY